MTERTVPRLSWSTLPALWRAGTSPRALLGRRIGVALREQLILHVSSVNDCAVCVAAHSVVGRVVGASAASLADARQGRLPDDERARAALRYAELRTAGREDASPEIVADFTELFDAEEQHEIRTIVDAFTFANRFNNTWESRLPGAERRRRWLGLRGGERPNESKPGRH